MNASISCRHVAHFYGHDEQPLIRNIGQYLADGLRLGGGLIIVTTDERRAALFRELEDFGVAPAGVIRTGRCRVAQTEEMLASLYDGDGALSYERFDSRVGSVVREMCALVGRKPVRAYGDMVAELWRRGDRAGAVELEGFWNRLQAEVPFDLLCAYPRGEEDDRATYEPIVQTHTQVVPEEGVLHTL